MSRTRWILDRTEDLELRLAPSFMSKGGRLTNNLIRSYPPNIIILDGDDDDAEEEDTQTRNLLHYSSSWAPELSEQDLELRLGLGAAYFRYPLESNGGTNVSERTRDPYAVKSGKKLKPKAGSCCAAPCGEEVKLRCTICMDTMKEETSTICGHVFCRPCITSAVLTQKKCPACRMKLSLQHIHRIYLPGSNS